MLSGSQFQDHFPTSWPAGKWWTAGETPSCRDPGARGCGPTSGVGRSRGDKVHWGNLRSFCKVGWSLTFLWLQCSRTHTGVGFSCAACGWFQARTATFSQGMVVKGELCCSHGRWHVPLLGGRRRRSRSRRGGKRGRGGEVPSPMGGSPAARGRHVATYSIYCGFCGFCPSLLGWMETSFFFFNSKFNFHFGVKT